MLNSVGTGGFVSNRTSFDCPPDTNWAGNVDILWSGSGQGGQVNKHYADLLACIGGAPSYIHFRGSNCTSPMPWTVTGVCAGFTPRREALGLCDSALACLMNGHSLLECHPPVPEFPKRWRALAQPGQTLLK